MESGDRYEGATPEQARKFFELVAIDESFRRRLQESDGPDDIVSVLDEFGISVPPALLPDKVRLPAPHQIQRVLEVHQEQDLLGTSGDAYLMIWIMHGAFPVLALDGGDGTG